MCLLFTLLTTQLQLTTLLTCQSPLLIQDVVLIMQDDALLAYQIAFDLVENENQAFLLNVRNRLDVQTPGQSNPDNGSASLHDQTVNEGRTSTEPAGDVQMGDDTTAANGNAHIVDANEVARADRLKTIKGILSGEKSIQLTLQFLYSHNRYTYTIIS